MTDYRLATVNLEQAQTERTHRSCSGVCVLKRDERVHEALLNKQGTLGYNSAQLLPKIIAEHPCQLLDLKAW